MRRHDRRRGAKVTGDADLEGLSPEMVFLERADDVNGSAGHNDVHVLASGRRPSRDFKAASSLTTRVRGNQGEPIVGTQDVCTSRQV